jgi:hypothetical protein
MDYLAKAISFFYVQEDRQLHGSILGVFAQQGECQQLSFPDPCEASAKNWSCSKPLVPGYGLPSRTAGVMVARSI